MSNITKNHKVHEHQTVRSKTNLSQSFCWHWHLRAFSTQITVFLHLFLLSMATICPRLFTHTGAPLCKTENFFAKLLKHDKQASACFFPNMANNCVCFAFGDPIVINSGTRNSKFLVFCYLCETPFKKQECKLNILNKPFLIFFLSILGQFWWFFKILQASSICIQLSTHFLVSDHPYFQGSSRGIYTSYTNTVTLYSTFVQFL